jgi:predicted PurR-regulated permease PerM
MISPKIRTSASDALVGIWAIMLTSFVIAMLYFGRELLIPLSLAALLTFLLSPLVTRIERWIGRIAAVLVMVILIFTSIGLGGWVLTRQMVDLATKLPEYKGNIITKIQSFKVPRGGVFTKLSEMAEEMKQALPGGTPATESPPVENEKAPPSTKPPLSPSPTGPPPLTAPEKKAETFSSNPFELIQTMIAPLLGPLGTSALVLLLVVFMLLQREDLRNRLIRLVGQGRISATTRAMDDAGDRVSRYLLMQLVVNVTYGIPVAIGLTFIGVPNPMLWGVIAVVLRFIPYVGPWIAAAFPITLALATSPDWTAPLLTIGLFVVLELLSNNVMEPWLYGSSTGVSPIPLIIAAVFWTWLWGSMGLVLATPLTVCMVVMGRHVPRLSFLSVLLSDEEALTPAEDCYHRLLTPGERDELELVETYLKTNPLSALYDSVFLPALTLAESDAREGHLEPSQLIHVEQSMRDIVEDLGTRPTVPEKNSAENAESTASSQPVTQLDCRLYCLPARADRDELAGSMLVQLARKQGFGAQNAPASLATGELIELTQKAGVDVVCISVVAPSTILHARYLCLRLRAVMPNQKIIIGLWGANEDLPASTLRLRESGADEVVTLLSEALVQISKLAPAITEEMTIAPIPADEEARLSALDELRLLDTEAEPVFDRITAKLARVFEVPVALITLVDRDRQFFKSQVGLPEVLARARQTPRNVSACGHVVAKNQVMVIEDLARDRRFANNPLFKEHGIRFYAGVPLLAPNGQPIGSLCLMDLKPRQLSEREKRLLVEYANDVMEEIAKRATLRQSKVANAQETTV